MIINDRIQQIIDYYKYNKTSFSNKIGLENNVTIGNIVGGRRSKPSYDILLKIVDSFPDVSEKWLLKGEGDMLVSNMEFRDSAILINPSVMYVPLVNQYAYGSYLNGYADPEYLDELPKVPFESDREHKGEYVCFEMKGDSMDDGSVDSYLEGDILLCRNVRRDYWKSKLHINKWDFVIVHKERGIVAKRIVKHDVDKGVITLHSLNDFYQDYDVNLEDVSQIFNIVDFKRRKKRR